MATRWGCVGPGNISQDFFLAIQDNLPSSDHEFVAVASTNQERAQKFADKFKFQKAYGSYDELAKDPDVEIVYIATLNTSHAELSIKMLEAGKHVLCEKPMGMNHKQVKQVLQVAKDKQKFFIEGVWSRFFPSYNKIRQELTNTTVGDVKLVNVNFCVPISEIERVKNAKLGGGGCLDIGCYAIQFACFVYGEMPESVTAVGTMLGDVDESACITLKYKNGSMASLVYHISTISVITATIIGTKGKIEVHEPFYCPTKVTTPTGTFEFPLKENKYCYPNSAGLHYEVIGIRECLLKGLLESPKMSHYDSDMIHQIMTEVRRQIGVKYPDFD
ncbi:hypothetical protein ACF0H5_020787 [Mactra antiquata]